MAACFLKQEAMLIKKNNTHLLQLSGTICCHIKPHHFLKILLSLDLDQSVLTHTCHEYGLFWLYFLTLKFSVEMFSLVWCSRKPALFTCSVLHTSSRITSSAPYTCQFLK